MLFGPLTRWPFLNGHRLILELTQAEEEPAGATRNDVRTLDAGPYRVHAYRLMAMAMQCPAVRFALQGPRGTLRAHYPDCGISDPAFHRETQAYVLAVLASARWDP